MKFISITFLALITFISCTKEDSMTIEDEVPVLETEPVVTDQCAQNTTFNTHQFHHAYQAILDSIKIHGFPGISALVYTPENGLWQGTIGFSSMEDNVALKYCDVLYSGSVAKTYTVTTAMALIEDGLFKLEDKISQYLPQSLIDSLPNAQIATIKQLMNHTAGMPDIDNDIEYEQAIFNNNGILPSAEEQLAVLFDDQPLFAPGKGVEYSSTHTMALAIIIDRVLNYDHSIAVTEKIIDKLNLNQTYYKNEASYPSPDKLVNGYVVFEEGPIENVSDLAVNYCNSVHGDAGIIASAYDYFQFMKNLVEGNIVSQASFDLMRTPEWIFELGDIGLGLGLGLIMTKTNHTITKIGHSGSTIGGESHVYYYPEKQAYLVLLTNVSIQNQTLGKIWSASFPSQEESILAKFEEHILK